MTFSAYTPRVAVGADVLLVVEHRINVRLPVLELQTLVVVVDLLGVRIFVHGVTVPSLRVPGLVIDGL